MSMRYQGMTNLVDFIYISFDEWLNFLEIPTMIEWDLTCKWLTFSLPGKTDKITQATGKSPEKEMPERLYYEASSSMCLG